MIVTIVFKQKMTILNFLIDNFFDSITANQLVMVFVVDYSR